MGHDTFGKCRVAYGICMIDAPLVDITPARCVHLHSFLNCSDDRKSQQSKHLCFCVYSESPPQARTKSRKRLTSHHMRARAFHAIKFPLLFRPNSAEHAESRIPDPTVNWSINGDLNSRSNIARPYLSVKASRTVCRSLPCRLPSVLSQGSSIVVTFVC